jgi:hypothetical protein
MLPLMTGADEICMGLTPTTVTGVTRSGSSTFNFGGGGGGRVAAPPPSAMTTALDETPDQQDYETNDKVIAIAHHSKTGTIGAAEYDPETAIISVVPDFRDTSAFELLGQLLVRGGIKFNMARHILSSLLRSIAALALM